MSDTRQLRDGDLVEVRYRTVVQPGGIWVGRSLADSPGVTDVVVEVVEPVDDPSKDPIGTLRRGPDGEIFVKHKTANNDTGSTLSWVSLGDAGFCLDSDAAGWPVVGSVPGTPAAEAQEFDASALADACDEYVRCYRSTAVIDEALEKVRAALAGRDPYRPSEPLPDWERELLAKEDAERAEQMNARDRCGEDTLTLNDDGSDEYARAVAESQRAPRVFRSDGPEPPTDVKCVEWLAYDPSINGTPFLKRSEKFPNAWKWVGTPLDPTDEWGHFSWPPNPDVFTGEFREVRS